MKTGAYAVILAGGKGTRLWPLSGEGASKAFVKIGGNRSLIEETLSNIRGVVNPGKTLFVVDRKQARSFRRLLRAVPGQNVLEEPCGRSTASAVGLAAINRRPEDILIVLPCDAYVGDTVKFRKALLRAVGFVKRNSGAIVCVGIKPAFAASGYGYIGMGKSAGPGVYRVGRFVEKPCVRAAAVLLKKKTFLWNAGIFVFTAGNMLAAMRRHSPVLYRQLMTIKKNRGSIKSVYNRMRNISLDYQVMEKVRNVFCVKGDFAWKDLGNWTSVAVLLEKKESNFIHGKAALKNTYNSVVYNSQDKPVGVVGARNMVVVNTPDGVLVCAADEAERVKELNLI
ncbi:MAG: mannose-1-phosphate guanylyltransferase [Candidatus Omnitrophota bacterium]